MADVAATLGDASSKMDKAVTVAKEDFASIRTGRANPALFNKIMVDYYGTYTALSQLASIQVPEARMAIVSPFDKGAMANIEKAIRDSDLGLNPATSGDLIRVPMPTLTEERRKDLIKVVRAEAESAKVAVRNIRRDANDSLKKSLKEKEMSEDDERRSQEEVQKITDKFIAEIDKLLQLKESELLAI